MPTITDEEFRRRAQWLAKYLAVYWRMPPLTGDSEERAYASWLASTRYRARQGRLPVTRVAILDAEVPAWREKTSRTSLTALKARAEQCRDFHERTGRWPSNTATDEAERVLGAWRNNLRRARREQQRVVDRIAPGWRGKPRTPVAKREDAFAARARTARRFRVERGRWPSTASVDPTEASLGAWWVKARSVTAPDSSRGLVLDRFCPGWRDGDREADWADWVRRLVAHREVHDSWPRVTGGSTEERALGAWLSRQRARRDQLVPARRALLDEQCPGWDSSSRRSFNDRVTELGAFFATHERWPSTTSDDQVEVGLAWWHLRQRNRSLIPEQVTALDAAAPGWLEREQERSAAEARPLGVRFTNFTENLESFYAAHRRAPHPAGLNGPERALAATLARYRADPRFGREYGWVLDRCCPGWDLPPAKPTRTLDAGPAAKAAPTRPPTFEVGVGALAVFFSRHLRQPAIAGDLAEARLARWLAVQRTADLTVAQEELLGAACPGWRAVQGRWRFEMFADQCALFVDRQGRWPSIGDLADVPGLVWWFGKLRRVDDPAKIAYLDKVVPGWREATSA